MHDDIETSDLSTDDIPAATPGRTLTTTITGYDVDEVQRMLVHHLAQRIEKDTLDGIRKEARGRAQARIAEVCEAIIDAEVRDVVTNGWEEVTAWGDKTGKRFTVRAFILDYLKREEGDGGFNSPRMTVVARLTRKAIEGVFTAEFAKEIDAAKADLRAQLNATVRDKFVQAIKSALGVQ